MEVTSLCCKSTEERALNAVLGERITLMSFFFFLDENFRVRDRCKSELKQMHSVKSYANIKKWGLVVKSMNTYQSGVRKCIFCYRIWSVKTDFFQKTFTLSYICNTQLLKLCLITIISHTFLLNTSLSQTKPFDSSKLYPRNALSLPGRSIWLHW